ncbi:MAG: hypothetical protein DWQ35_09810 [Planctomycetota bacterium]|nr:MAG: hypothetical protein DWQ35_09810 [Planctomycetota bacterium]
MKKRHPRTRTTRSLHIETLEDRVVLSSHSIADFTLDSAYEQVEKVVDPGIDQSLFNAHEQSGLTAARNAYGFTGAGQTVAVIDTGIAYDHISLGQGYGSSYRVVGGWDFAENDANPYDDASMGSHGTHVAGIVGSDHVVHSGVAPGVDLVALRVFDDSGAGYFSWVEDALDWVHANRNSFDNPITTVNLSLGAEWNSSSIPSWANLEDEFAQLEADGIFIAVAAGNSFTSYNTTGLSYPAVSPYVVPVSSVNDAGQLSYFSQRDAGVIAAPGQGIVSTVPDYVGNFNGQTDDFATFSGTSMASPYVAGASVLLRQAFEFVGQANVTQDQIYAVMQSTADQVWDAATNQSYARLNIEAAIDAVMPADDYGSTLATAYGLGTVADNDPGSIAGSLGRLDDADYFTFTATASGTASFDLTSSDGTAQWDASAISAASTDANGKLSFAVVAGQTYTVGVESGGTLTTYDVDYEIEAAMVDWGVLEYQQFSDQRISGENWFALQASRDGLFTIEALFAHTAGNVDLVLYDADGNEVASSNSSTNNERVDVTAAAGDQLFLRVTGTNSDVDFHITNLIGVNGNRVTVHGTANDDVIRFSAGNNHALSINGVAYEFNAATYANFQIQESAGNDVVTLVGSNGNEFATLRADSGTLTDGSYTVTVANAEQLEVHGGTGSDRVVLYDSIGNDSLVAYATHGHFQGNGFHNAYQDFERTIAYATAGGQDVATFYDSAGDDQYLAYSTHSIFRGSGFSNVVHGFESTEAHATAGGNDLAYFWDSAGNDNYVAHADRSWMKGTGFHNQQHGFERTIAYARFGGHDVATFYDSAGDDNYVAYADKGWMSGDGFFNYQAGFKTTYAYATAGGYDRANFIDSAGDDTYFAYATHSYLQGDGFYNYQSGFEFSEARATNGGNDLARFYDSAGNDNYVAHADRSWMQGAGFHNQQDGFERTIAYATAGGQDVATFYDSAGDDQYLAYSTHSIFRGSGFSNVVHGFESTEAHATAGGNDLAYFWDSAGNDNYVAHADRSWMKGTGFHNQQHGFERTIAYARFGGHDVATFYDSAGDDNYVAYADKGWMSGDGFFNYQAGFKTTRAVSTGGNDVARFVSIAADDAVYGRDSHFEVAGAEFVRSADSFASVFAVSIADDIRDNDVDSVDYLFTRLGNWE